MAEWIMKEETDMDGVDCYIKKGEIIRCRNCKHWQNVVPSDLKVDGLEWRFCHGFNEMTTENGFCFKGERKASDENGKVR